MNRNLAVMATVLGAIGCGDNDPAHVPPDLRAPGLVITAGPRDPVPTALARPAFTFEVAGATSVTCRITSEAAPQPAFAPCTASFAPAEPLADGGHELEVVAADDAGNETRRARAFTVDTIAPALAIEPPAIPARTSDRRPVVYFTAADASGVVTRCEVDAGGAIDCDGTVGFTAPADLPEGRHVYRVTATDAAGNATGADVVFDVDVTPPALAITDGPPSGTNDDTPSFAFTTGADVTRARCEMDTGEVIDPCASGVTFPPIAEGLRTFTVTAYDDAVPPNAASATHAFLLGRCGNGVVEQGEACDGANLGGATCGSLGFHSGTLACTSACTFDTRACFAPANTGFVGKVCFDGVRYPAPGNGNYVVASTEDGGVLRSTIDPAPVWSSINGTGTASQVVNNLHGRGVFPQLDGPGVVILADNSGANAFRSGNVGQAVPTTWNQLSFTSGGMPVELFAARPASAANNILGGWHPALGAVVLHGMFTPTLIAPSAVGAGVTGTVRSIAAGATGATTDVYAAVFGQTPAGDPATGGIYWTCDQVGAMGGTYVARDAGIPAADKPLVWSLTVDPSSFTAGSRTCPTTGGTVSGYARTYFAALRGGGQVYKTIDGGESWSRANAGLPDGAEVYKIAIDCFSAASPVNCPGCRCVDPGLLYAATNAGLYRSTNGGATWALAALGGKVVRGVTLQGEHPVGTLPRVFVGVDDAVGIYQANYQVNPP